MKEEYMTFQELRIAVTASILVAILVLAIVVGIAGNALVGLIAFIGLVVAFVGQGIENIPANPPTKAMPMFWGKFTGGDSGELIGPGLTFFPFRGFLFGYTLIDARQINFTVTLDERTPDNGEVHVEPFFSYAVDPKRPLAFLTAGDQGGVEQKFGERVSRALREWISSRSEGPQTWQEARQSNGLALDTIIENLFPGRLPKIVKPTTLPKVLIGITDAALMKYFTGKPPLYDPNNKNFKPGKDDEAWKEALDRMESENPDMWDELRRTVQERLNVTNKAKEGGVNWPIADLGIVVFLTNLGSIDPVSKTAEAADEVAQARQDLEVKELRAIAYRTQIAEMKKILDDPRISTDAVAIQWGIVKKRINETQIRLAPDIINAIEEIGLEIAGRIR